MKKVFATVLLSFSLLGVCFAQEIEEEPGEEFETVQVTPVARPQNELDFSLSYFTYPQAQYIAGGIVAAIIAGLFGVSIPAVIIAPGCFGVEYNHYFNKVIAVGGGVSLDYVSCLGLANGLYVSVLPDIKFRWLNKEKIRMYSKLAAGCTVGWQFSSLSSDVSPDTRFAWEITTLGFEFNTKADNFNWFIDFGLGTQGLFGFGFNKTF